MITSFACMFRLELLFGSLIIEIVGSSWWDFLCLFNCRTFQNFDSSTIFNRLEIFFRIDVLYVRINCNSSVYIYICDLDLKVISLECNWNHLSEHDKECKWGEYGVDLLISESESEIFHPCPKSYLYPNGC